MKRIAITLLAALAWATFAGCSKQPVTANDAAPSTASTAGTTTTTALSTDKKAAILEAGIVKEGDFGPDWTKTARKKSGSKNAPAAAKQKDCASVLDAIESIDAVANDDKTISPSFSKGKGVQARSETNHFPSPDAAKAAVSIYAQENLSCLQAILEDGAGSASSPTKISEAVSTRLDGVGDVGYEVRVSVTTTPAGGAEITDVLGFYAVAVGPFVVTLDTESDSGDFPAPRPIVQAQVARLQKAMTG